MIFLQAQEVLNGFKFFLFCLTISVPEGSNF